MCLGPDEGGSALERKGHRRGRWEGGVAGGMTGCEADADGFGSGSRNGAWGAGCFGAVKGDEEVRGRRSQGKTIDEVADFAWEVEEGRWHFRGPEVRFGDLEGQTRLCLFCCQLSV